MIDKKQLSDILSDLYALDPSLRNREKELMPLIEKLIKAKPQTALNEAFAAELKKQLLAKADGLGQKNSMKKEKKSWFKIDWKVMAYASTGTAALVLVAVVASSMMIFRQNSLVVKHQAPTLKNQIVKVSRNAFGSLALAQNASPVGGNREVSAKINNISPSPLASNDGGVPVSESAISSAAPAGLGVGAAGNSKMMADASYIMPPNYGTIKYVYAGEDFSLPSGQATVYKNLTNAMSDFSSVLSALSGSGISQFDVSQFKGLKIDSFNIKEDRDFGYYLGFYQGNDFYISKNWGKWPNPFAKCQDDKCWQENRIKLSDMISDEEAIAIAKNFVSEYKINLEGYGQPVVSGQWRAVYEASMDKENYYFPEEVQVLYPLLIDGQEVRGASGELQGAVVTVDIRNRKASGLNNLLSLNFEASEYETVADKSEVIKLAEEGGQNGRYQYYYGSEGEKETIVELDTPKLVLVHSWRYNEEIAQGDNIYVPAYMFPLKNKPQDPYFYTESIIVPLVKDVIAQIDRPMLYKADPVAVPETLDIALPVPTPAAEPVMENVKPK